MKNYLDLLSDIMDTGEDRAGRNGWTRSKFAQHLSFDLTQGFPAITTKKLYYKSVVAELLWFLTGSPDEAVLQFLAKRKKTIWRPNIDADYWKPYRTGPDDAGRIYGVQWRSWRSLDRQGEPFFTDQIANLIQNLRMDPFSRRHVVTAWNPGEIEDNQLCLPPCPVMFICYIDKDWGLHMHVIQRSGDMFIGVPFDIASYATLAHLICHCVNTAIYAKELTLSITDAHLYHEHFNVALKQLKREPFSLPKLWLNPDKRNIDSFKPEDFRLEGYRHHEALKARMLV